MEVKALSIGNKGRQMQRIITCLVIILLGVLLPGEKICHTEDWKDTNYLQTLPDQSFALVEKKPDGTIIRSLPHHDRKGNLLIPKLEEALDHVFDLDPKYQTKVRDHLLGDYYEYVINPTDNKKSTTH